MPISDPFRNPTGIIPRVRTAYSNGTAVLVPINIGTPLDPEMDRIISVWELVDLATLPAANDRTDVATINAAGNIVINSDTSGSLIVVTWNDHDWGETENAPWQE